LLDRGSQQFWPAGSRDKTSKNIEEHAEKLSYRAGQQFVLDRLGNCAEITTLEPCIMCSATLAQGDIGRILAAAPREAVVRDDESSILRQRKLGLYAVLEDSDVRTHAYIGYNADRSVELWREWDDRITNKKRSIYLSR
jgi:tRNA(Arg) A34 adenosine deaminase TadA